ncbi:MAG: MMPL family transporter [Chloroflexi bacterium]|nr:MMPL family transporter [Chloroflexota bacterium]
MFSAIGRLADRYRIPLLLGWILVAIAVTALAPNLEDVTSNDQSNFLPDDASSRVGRELVNTNFPQQASQGSIVVVFEATDGTTVTDETNTAFIGRVSNWLASAEAPQYIAAVQSPTLNPDAAGALISQDQQVAMVVVALNTTDLEQRRVVLDAIGDELKAAPASLNTYRSGEVAIFSEYDENITSSVDRTIFVTLILVVVILLAIYRSPVSPLIPLGVVTIAFLIARGIVAWLAESTLTISGTATMLLIVVMYGAGTDYCLFLISRFQEEMADGLKSRKAVQNTVHRVGESISSSAGTVVVGFMAMTFSKLGLFNTTGPTLAIGVVVSLLAGLTLTPALLGLLGKWAFWPSKPHHRNTGAMYKRTSQWVSARPLQTILLIVVLMAPMAVYGMLQEQTYDTLKDLPEDTESVEGFRVLEDHIGAGQMQPLTGLAIFDSGDLQANTAALTEKLSKVAGVAYVRSASQPLGPGTQLPADVQQQLGSTYLNTATNAARFEIVLKNEPYSAEAMDAAEKIKDVLNANSKTSGLEGSTAQITDIRSYLADDQRLTIALVLGGIFIILMIMLRSIVAPMYLIGTILLSYTTTLGITRLASNIIWGSDQLTWWVPFFMFVFLVALGIDYSIFLFGRMKEEVRKYGSPEGIHHSVQATGSIITSAGIIVAGTFGAMMAGSILGLAQIGFAVSVGILIDTFVVRTILDPALAAFFRQWTWWPGGIARIEPAETTPDTKRSTGAMPQVGGAD